MTTNKQLVELALELLKKWQGNEEQLLYCYAGNKDELARMQQVVRKEVAEYEARIRLLVEEK